MKAILIIMCSLIGTITAHSQERSVQLQQMLKLKLQSFLSNERINVDQNGLNDIAREKSGTNQLFGAHFNSLRQVSGSVKDYEKVQDIRVVNQAIRRTFEVTITNAKRSGTYGSGEMQYFQSTYSKVLKDCREVLTNLDYVLTSGQYQMSDDQRIKRIDQLHERMISSFRFTRSFCYDVEVVRLSRQREKNDAQTIQGLYGTIIEK